MPRKFTRKEQRKGKKASPWSRGPMVRSKKNIERDEKHRGPTKST